MRKKDNIQILKDIFVDLVISLINNLFSILTILFSYYSLEEGIFFEKFNYPFLLTMFLIVLLTISIKIYFNINKKKSGRNIYVSI
jgi:hypothetical protein